MEVVTYPSTDEGVAFIIDVAGVRLYFAGDLNYWYWEGEPKEWNLGQERDYRAALEQIHSQVEGIKKEWILPLLYWTIAKVGITI